jgi:broad specificity phosphatase PhoE
MPTRLLLIRHAECVGNVAGELSPAAHSGLTARGLRQAASVRARLASQNRNVAALFASPLQRAVATCDVVFPGVKPVLDPRLAEVNAGDMCVAANCKVDIAGYVSARFPGGESYGDVFERVAQFLEDSLGDAAGRELAVVAHGGPIVCMLHLLLDIPLTRFPGFRIDNASITEIEIETSGNTRRAKANFVNTLLYE